MPPTATLAQYIGAETVRKVEGGSNTYKLDGTKYIVPDDVLTAAESLQSDENIRGRDVSSNPTPTDLVDFSTHPITEQRGRTLFKYTPSTIRAITEFSGLAINHGECHVGSMEQAEAFAAVLRDAEDTAAQHYPGYWEEEFGAEYSVEVLSGYASD